MYLSLAFCLMFCEVDVVVGCVGFIFSLIVFLVGSQAAKTMEGKREWVHLNYGGKEVGVCLHLTTSIPLLRGGGGGGSLVFFCFVFKTTSKKPMVNCEFVDSVGWAFCSLLCLGYLKVFDPICL